MGSDSHLAFLSASSSCGPSARLFHADSHRIFDYRGNAGTALRSGLLSCGHRARGTRLRAPQNSLALRLSFLRFGMNCYAINLRKFFLHAIFQRGAHVVYLRYRQFPAHHAMAGSENMMLDLPHQHVMGVQ